MVVIKATHAGIDFYYNFIQHCWWTDKFLSRSDAAIPNQLADIARERAQELWGCEYGRVIVEPL